MKDKIKIVLFLLIFISLLYVTQRIMIPKWYYSDNLMLDSATKIVAGYYEEERNSLQVIVAGTSHMMYGFSPMEIYDKYEIKSYNLATSGQTLPVTYYTLEEALKTQNPEVFILDVSALYLDVVGNETLWRYLLDSMPLSLNKIEFAHEFDSMHESYSFLDAVFPVLRYHERWKELKKKDFTDFFRNKNYYSKGYNLISYHAVGPSTVALMNKVQQELESITLSTKSEYKNGISIITEKEMNLYDETIDEENIEWLLKIAELCESHGVDLLLTKIPANFFPQIYPSAWTEIKSQEVKKLCALYEINYFDLLYDTDIGLDWATDTNDGGMHLNLLGATKVSDTLGRYLQEYYDLEQSYNEEWEKDRIIYEQVKKIALLQLENDFIEYIDKLRQSYNDKIVFFAASDDMASNLGEDGTTALRNLGFQSEFGYAKSFLAVIENGELIYESSANTKISHSGKTSTGQSYSMTSSGWYTNFSASIKINGVEYARNSRGLNIVVYDPECKLVLDSVCFDTWSEGRTASRSNVNTEIYLREYENYLTAKEEQ